jgi:hypothetical protein
MEITVFAPDGSVIETGLAKSDQCRLDFTYPVKHPAQLVPGVTVRITVCNFSGERTSKDWIYTPD